MAKMPLAAVNDAKKAATFQWNGTFGLLEINNL